jgi:hypothetical protein
MVAGQKVVLGRLHQHRTVTVTVSDTTLAIDLDDGDAQVVRRTTGRPVRSIKGLIRACTALRPTPAALTIGASRGTPRHVCARTGERRCGIVAGYR